MAVMIADIPIVIHIMGLAVAILSKPAIAQ